MKVRELMTPNPVAIGPETPLKDVAAILVERGISGLPVIGERLEVMGVVSEADILVKEQGPEPPEGGLVGRLLTFGLVDDRRLAARTAAEAMSAPAVTIGPEHRVAEAARTMLEHGVSRLPVVGSDGTLVGIVTRADLMRGFSRSDDELEREIGDDVLANVLLITDENLQIRVTRGDVRLSGRLERRSDTELLPRVVARVPGVVSVHSTLRWRWDDRKAVPKSSPRVPNPARRA
jgi:CBS domain-containing protein